MPPNAFAWSVGVCVLLVFILCLSTHRGLGFADAFASALLTGTALFMGIFGIRGQTWNDEGSTLLKRITPTGRFVVLLLAFGAVVGAIQRFHVQSGLEEERQAKHETQIAKNQRGHEKTLNMIRSENSSLKSELSSANDAVGELRKKLDREEAAAAVRRAEREKEREKERTRISGKLNKIEGFAASCSPEIRQQLTAETNALRSAIDSGAFDRHAMLLEKHEELLAAISDVKRHQASSARLETAISTVSAIQGDLDILAQTIGRLGNGAQPAPAVGSPSEVSPPKVTDGVTGGAGTAATNSETAASASSGGNGSGGSMATEAALGAR